MTGLAPPTRPSHPDLDAWGAVSPERVPIPAPPEALTSTRRADRAKRDLQRHRQVGQAVGILMERYEITDDRALHVMQRLAIASGSPIEGVAREVVEAMNARARAEAPPEDRLT